MAKTNLSIDFKSASFYALKLVLTSADNQTIFADLSKKITEAGDFYADEAIVIDVSNLDKAPTWPTLIDTLKENQMHPIGIISNADLESACHASGLPVLDITGSSHKIVVDKKPNKDNQAEPTGKESDDNSKPTEPSENQTRKTKIINKPLRSGQSIYAKDSDLIVIGMVSKGAEIIADGNIHVYGPLRGKAIAGARGDTSSLILTTQLDAELLAIAGVYRVIETDLPSDIHDKPAKIELSGGTLKFQQLK